MESLEGLLIYEKVFLLLGILFFVALLVLLIIFVVQKRQIKPLLPFFLVPVLMIGYPSVKKIQWIGLVITLDRQTNKAEQVSSDAPERQELNKTVEEIKRRSPTRTGTLMTIARAEAVLGDTAEALKFVNMALDKVPENKNAIKLKEKIQARAIDPSIPVRELHQDSAAILNR